MVWWKASTNALLKQVLLFWLNLTCLFHFGGKLSIYPFILSIGCLPQHLQMFYPFESCIIKYQITSLLKSLVALVFLYSNLIINTNLISTPKNVSSLVITLYIKAISAWINLAKFSLLGMSPLTSLNFPILNCF